MVNKPNKKKQVFSVTSLFLFIFVQGLYAQTDSNNSTYEIDATKQGIKLYSNHLKLGGENHAGKKITFNNYYMLIDDRPVIPVMGEFHYARYPNQYWEDAILKMKSGGITLMATYVFWNLHEEEEGQFVWTGDKDLRHFIELCRKHNLEVIVRIGPFCHGEIRNGGIPDWLYGRPFQVRSNDERYLFYVKRLYNQIGKQLKGLLFNDGGPVVGIQLENECQHSAAPWAFSHPGQKIEYTIPDVDYDTVMPGVSEQQKKHSFASLGQEHMRILKKMAIDAGLVVPLYTATGWGYAALVENEMLPVQAAYPYPTWDNSFAPSKFYLFTNIHKNPDYSPVRYKAQDYPYFCAEMAGGMVSFYERRPTVPAQALDALVIRTVGSGANGIGYYMYHGGLTPTGKKSFMSDEAIGLPCISYDFQAPIGEFGQIRPSYHSLRTIHLFLNDFGNILAPMETILPTTNENITPVDSNALRFAVRVKGDSGFIFMTNYQDYAVRHDQSGLQIKVRLPNEAITIPENGAFTLKKDASVILPFNLMLDEVKLKYATAQLLAKLEDGNTSHYFFYAIEGIAPTFVIDNSCVRTIESETATIHKATITKIDVKAGFDSNFEIRATNGKQIIVTTLTRDQALNTAKVNISGKNHIIVTDAMLLVKEDKMVFRCTGNSNVKFWLYTDGSKNSVTYDGHALSGIKTGFFTGYEAKAPEVNISAKVEAHSKQRYSISVPAKSFNDIHELYLTFDYVGDNAMAFIDGRMVCDNFYFGKTWTVGLKRFMPALAEKGMYFYFRPIYKESPFLRDLAPSNIPDFSGGDVVNVKSASFIPEYEFSIKMSE